MAGYTKGIIVNCLRVVLVDAPSINAKPVTSLTCLTEVNINLSRSNENFYCIANALGEESFCLKGYVILKD